MTNILRIDSSSRPASRGDGHGDGSFSRALADHIVARLVEDNSTTTHIERDLIAEPIPHISDTTIKGYYAPFDAMPPSLRQATALSDALIKELRSADIVVLSAPLYNFSVPSALKAWIDQIVRIGHTFAYEDGQFRGLLSDRPTYLALSYGAGGYGPGGAMESYDYLRPYLSHVMAFIGLSSVEVFAVEATTAPDASDNLRTALRDVDARLKKTAVAQ